MNTGSVDTLSSETRPSRRKRRVHLQFTIFASFCLLTILLIVAIISYTYWTNERAASRLAQQLLTQTSETVIERTQSLITPLFSLANAVPLIPRIGSAPTLAIHPSAAFLMDAAEEFQQISSAYLGFHSGEFFQINFLENMPEALAASYNAPDGTKFVVRRIIAPKDGGTIEYWQYLDLHRRLVDSRAARNPGYDPRRRPWFVAAADTYLTAVIDPYLFASGANEYGVTVSKRFGGQVPGVFGVDLALDNISHFLAQQRQLHAGQLFSFIVSNEGYLIATSIPSGADQVDAATRNLADAILARLKIRILIESGGEPKAHQFNLQGTDYLYHFERLPENQIGNATLAIVAPKEAFTATIDRARQLTIAMSVVALLLSLPAIILVSRRISQPLMQLMEEVNSIRNLEFEERHAIQDSRIIEIAMLVDAFEQMKMSLLTFGKYVPRDLVMQIVRSNVTPEIGGTKTPIGLMFSDIQDFTRISEELGAEHLMQQMSVYLDGMVEVIQSHNGTVDKYIGDAIMAVWNAPRRDADYATNACLEALRCRNWLARQNREWQHAGRHPMYTRIGLHAGDAVVGNVGSRDRMDYTALGSTVNEGARLEGLNKYYGTDIIVSDSIVKLADAKLYFRELGRVQPKGVQHPIAIFELLGIDPEQAQPEEKDICATAEQLLLRKEWSIVLQYFHAGDWSSALAAIGRLPSPFHDDGVARRFIGECRQRLDASSEPEWDGIQKFDSK